MSDAAADVRRDIEMARERMSDTLSEIEQRVEDVKDKVNVRRHATEFVGEHPWIALGIAAGAGALLAASRADARAARATTSAASAAAGAAARKAPSIVKKAPTAARGLLAEIKTRIGDAIDSSVHSRIQAPLQSGVDKWVAELVEAIGPRHRT